jgi:hypothetical protein
MTLFDIPKSFSSLAEAKTFYDDAYRLYSSQASPLVCDSGILTTDIEARFGRFQALMLKFSLALRALAASNLKPKEDLAVAVLQLHVLSNYILLHLERITASKISSWKEFLPEFNEMIALGEKIISATSDYHNHQKRTTAFCLDMGITIPPFNVANQCREPVLRRKAIELLRSTSRQEGLWNSVLVADAAERIAELQESGLGEMVHIDDQGSVRPVFEIDAKGGRLHYVKLLERGGDVVNVVEEIFAYKSS